MLSWTRGATNESEFKWASMQEALPAFMERVSLSLLSGAFLPRNRTYFNVEWGLCLKKETVYEYSAGRLLGMYGTGWIVSMLSLAVGFFYVGKNGRERDMEFSHLVKGLGPGREAMKSLEMAV